MIQPLNVFFCAFLFAGLTFTGYQPRVSGEPLLLAALSIYMYGGVFHVSIYANDVIP